MKLAFDSVSYTYPSGVDAIKELSLEIASGETLVLVGENGAGKSTLVKQLNGLLRPSSGKVHIGDWEQSQHTTAQLARRVAFLFQNPDEQLFERTVWREVAFGPRNLAFSPEKIDEKVRSALQRVGLIEYAEKHPYDLQYTQRKLIALAATLAMDTPVLVLDEPTVGQDAIQQRAIGKIIMDLKNEGRTQIIITHDLDFCADIADRVVVMAQGKILDDGPAQEVLVQSEILAQASVDAPQIVRLAQSLNMSNTPLSIEAFVEEFADWKANQGKSQ